MFDSCVSVEVDIEILYKYMAVSRLENITHTSIELDHEYEASW